MISGDNFASQYGYALTTADVDSDGYSDLFVAAPFYHRDQAGGAVYYYRNTASGLDTISDPVILTGGPESRFGFALSSAGDVNSDGYEDLVVGAPYEGRGAVYLYQGSAKGLRTKPSQIIHGHDVPGAPLNTFGYSLSGGLDMDLNNHSDVLVGAYQSDSVVILRARPVIDIITWFGEHLFSLNDARILSFNDPLINILEVMLL